MYLEQPKILQIFLLTTPLIRFLFISFLSTMLQRQETGTRLITCELRTVPFLLSLK